MVAPKPFLSERAAARVGELKRRGLLTRYTVGSKVDVTFWRGRDTLGTFACVVNRSEVDRQFSDTTDPARTNAVTQTLLGTSDLNVLRVRDIATYGTVRGTVTDVRQRSPEITEVSIEIVRGRAS